jgi:hypothetical protein
VKLYFYGSNRLEQREGSGLGLIAFAVPDIGFMFRSTHRGNALECELYALLTLCQFVEANLGLFKGQKLEFLGDSTAAVYQVSQPEGSLHSVDHSLPAVTTGPVHFASGSSARLLERLRAFRKKLGFSLLWVPLSENRAASEAAFHPIIKNSPLAGKLNTSFLEVFKPKRNPEQGPSTF